MRKQLKNNFKAGCKGLDESEGKMEICGNRSFGRAGKRSVWLRRRPLSGAADDQVEQAGRTQGLCHLGNYLIPVHRLFRGVLLPKVPWIFPLHGPICWAAESAE